MPGPTPQPGDAVPTPPGPASARHDDVIPLEPAPEPTIPIARAARLTDIPREDRCPNCGRPMAHDAVVCMACGYDLKANRVVKPETGVELIEPPAPAKPDEPEFVKPGGTPRVLGIVGGVLAIAAVVAAVANADPRTTTGGKVSLGLYTLYETLLHTGTGAVALWIVARLLRQAFNRVDLAVARMLVVVAAFHLVVNLRLPLGNETASRLLAWPLATGVYYLVLFGLFRRDRKETGMVLLAHLAVWGFVEIGIQIAVWLKATAGVPG